MRLFHKSLLAVVVCAFVALPAHGQTFATEDSVLPKIWQEAMENSQLEKLAHELLDVIGPRLVGTPPMQKAHDWAVAKYTGWGVAARNEQWGKWRGWERGVTHVDLLAPRVRTLEGTMLAWSPGTPKNGIQAGTIIIPEAADSAAFQKWLPTVKGKFVLISMPQPTGRPDKDWEEFATKESFEKMKAARDTLRHRWEARTKKAGLDQKKLAQALENAGAAGIIASNWSRGYGVNKIFDANTKKIPTIDLSLEDYGLVYRLTENGGNPVIRLVAEAKFLGAVPAYNTIGEMRGGAKSDEYVMLSAHFDSWDASSGATDNGTGTILMMEAMRVLKKVYPNPQRTIIAGHWGSEEQGLNGSRAFVKDHPDIVEKLQALFNQDNGTGRIERMSAGGYIDAGESLARWLARVPSEVTQNIKFDFAGMPSGGGTDNASFIAAGATGFGVGSNSWNYGTYTWHTNRDTYDKLVFDDLKNNVVLVASLVYLASEDEQFVGRTKRLMPMDKTTNKRREWPVAKDAERAGGLEEEKKAANAARPQ
jgi:hypothetical protein